MASQIDIDRENLRTDACPSPPRDHETSTSKPEGINKQESTSNSKQRKNKSKFKRTPAQAVANVFNINNAVGLHIGSNIVINMAKSEKSKESNVEPIKTEAICNLLERTDILTNEIMDLVSEHIGKNWRVVMRSLGYSNGQIEQYYEKNFNLGIREVVYQILRDWCENKPEEATVGVLSTALWNAPETDVVERLTKINFEKK